jgi:hypothetical protein
MLMITMTKLVRIILFVHFCEYLENIHNNSIVSFF